jgi:hypothetical protein
MYVMFSMSDIYDDTTTKQHDHVCSLLPHTQALHVVFATVVTTATAAAATNQWISPITITMSTTTHTSLA